LKSSKSKVTEHFLLTDEEATVVQAMADRGINTITRTTEDPSFDTNGISLYVNGKLGLRFEADKDGLPVMVYHIKGTGKPIPSHLYDYIKRQWLETKESDLNEFREK